MEHLCRPDIQYAKGRDAEALASKYTKEQIEDFGARVAQNLHLAPGGNIFDLVDALGGKVHYESALTFLEEDATIIVHAESDFDIALTEFGNTRRDRFTLAHEVGHYLLHSRLGKYPMMANRKGSNRLEWEANWFAAGMLMPEAEFRLLSSRGMGAYELANYFRVSEAAAIIRLKSLGL